MPLGQIESSEPAVLASGPIPLPQALRPQEAPIELKHFEVQCKDAIHEFLIDDTFLRHVITVLLSNHNITTTTKDLHDIFTYFGDVELKTQKQHVQKRSAGSCCGDVDIDDVIETVTKIVVGGVNIIKRVPDLITFVQSLGIAI
jgi:hypothetical protein